MKLKASLLVTASFMTLVLVAISLLRSTSQPLSDAEPTPNALALASSLLQPSTAPIKPSVSPDSVDALLDRPLHPGAPTSGTLNQRLSVDKSIDRVKQIDQTLASLRQRTHNQAKASTRSIVEGKQKALATQTLTIHNRLGSVTGTLKKQDYEIKKLSFELAQKQFQDGEIPRTLLDQQQANYQKSAHELKMFLNSSRIAD